jgi:hypothetical protein
MAAENESQIEKHPEELDTTKRTSGELQEASEPQQEPEEKKSLITKFQAAFRRGRDGRYAGAGAAQKEDRTAKSTDRSKGLVALLVCGFLVAVVLVGMFSHSSGDRPGSAAKRTKPSLGRREQRANSGQEKRGSVTPLHSADLSDQNPSSDEVDAEDIKKTARVRLQPRQEPKAAPTLASIPADPALEAYRRSREANMPLPPPPPTAATVAASAPRTDSDGLKKASLVFVRNDVNGTAGLVRPAVASTEPALLEKKNSGLLPAGSKLVARLQAAVSTAVKTPVVAAIEYNYERDGEIIIPAGTKAFGELQQANRSGIVNVRFHTLQMADGATEEINGTGMSLSYGPLKGSVSGSNRAKRVLVRSMTGIGTMAAFLVGGPGGFSGASGALDNSILLRERIASNAGLAGEQELMSLALNENIVITVPANTRFFIVLQDGSGDSKTTPRTLPARMPERSQVARAAAGSPLPTAQELRELMELKSELNRTNGEVTATSTSISAAQSPQREE